MAIEALKEIMEAEQKAQQLKEKTEKVIQQLSAETQEQLKIEREKAEKNLQKIQEDLQSENLVVKSEYSAIVQRETAESAAKFKQAQAEKSSEIVAEILLEVQRRYGNQ